MSGDGVEERLRRTENMVTELSTSMIDLKQSVSEHNNKCPFNSYKDEIEDHVTEMKKDVNKTIDDKDNTIKWILGILFTILIMMIGSIGGLQMSKVSVDSFERNIESTKQDQIRSNEKMLFLYENQNKTQRDLLSEISDLKIAIAGLTKSLEKL